MNKKRRCRNCKKYKVAAFMKIIHGAAFCDIECATQYAYASKDKGKDIKHKQEKKTLKDNDKSLRTKAAQQAFNAFIRQRDGNICISCQRAHQGQIHAGHYKSVGSSPELRFCELNCHSQCSACNNYLSGNIGEYRKHLIKKIGLDNVLKLEGPHKAKKYTCKQLKQIELKYKDKVKIL